MGKIQSLRTNATLNHYLSSASLLALALTALFSGQSADALGFISHHSHAASKLPSHWQTRTTRLSSLSHAKKSSSIKKSARFSKKTALAHQPSQQTSNTESYVNQDLSSIQAMVAHLQSKELMPGIIYKKGLGSLHLNILDIDTAQAPVVVKPIVAPQGSTRLQTVKDHTFSSHAIAAINANYFKTTGVPLGTLIIDGDWVAGPLYDRVALGVSKSGFVRIDRVALGGTLLTSNPQVPKIWVNNINAPRRSGCHTIAYSRRWGSSVHLDYDGALVALDAQGRVLDTNSRDMTIPYGGLVLTDSKDSAIAALQRGDKTDLHWQVSPQSWDDVNQAVSGGPMLIKNNDYCINLKAESFRDNWTSSKIKARTACGVTANNHLLLVTAEGTHTLYDLAHILHELGATDAMNLDGGGSTTMVIHDSTVNMESKSKERKVAVALGIFVMDKKDKAASNPSNSEIPSKESPLNLQPPITAEKPADNQAFAN